MCCKLMGVADLQPPKPVNEWCTHCTPGKGCAIYDARPKTCREFECVWLMSQSQREPMPLSLRPDKSKVVLDVTGRGDMIHAHVAPDQPDAWQRGEIGRLLAGSADKGIRVVVSHGYGQEKLLLEKRAGHVIRRKITMSAPDENGMQWYEPKGQA